MVSTKSLGSAPVTEIPFNLKVAGANVFNGRCLGRALSAYILVAETEVSREDARYRLQEKEGGIRGGDNKV